jgi:hypothetical protein
MKKFVVKFSSEDKIAVCEKTAGLRCGKFLDLKSVCSKVLVPIKIFQFQDMLNENRFLGTFRGHSKRPMKYSFVLYIFKFLTSLPKFRDIKNNIIQHHCGNIVNIVMHC